MTARYFGETEELLRKYAWYNKNSEEMPWPVGSLKPNDLGLFNALGNVCTWCQESYKVYAPGQKMTNDIEDWQVSTAPDDRVLRGGSFYNHASNLRSAFRFKLCAVDKADLQWNTSVEDFDPLNSVLLYYAQPRGDLSGIQRAASRVMSSN